MKGFRYIKTRESWSRRKKLSDGSTAIMEFWKSLPGKPFEYGIWICLVPKGRWREIIKNEEFCEITGNGNFEHLPFFVNTLEDFIAQNPGARIVAGAEESRRADLYRKFLPRFGFVEYPYGIGLDDWAMVLDVHCKKKKEG